MEFSNLKHSFDNMEVFGTFYMKDKKDMRDMRDIRGMKNGRHGRH